MSQPPPVLAAPPTASVPPLQRSLGWLIAGLVIVGLCFTAAAITTLLSVIFYSAVPSFSKDFFLPGGGLLWAVITILLCLVGLGLVFAIGIVGRRQSAGMLSLATICGAAVGALHAMFFTYFVNFWQTLGDENYRFPAHDEGLGLWIAVFIVAWLVAFIVAWFGFLWLRVPFADERSQAQS